jgi:lysozyme
MSTSRRTLLATGLSAAGTAVCAKTDGGLVPLANEPSRGQLFERLEKEELSGNPAEASEKTKYFNLYGPFSFPTDVKYDSVLQQERKDCLFGVDISHYTPRVFPIERLKQKEVQFIYLKVSQGVHAYDPTFPAFYSRVLKLPQGAEIHPGAYHFLSSAAGGREQADLFIKILKNNGAIVDGKLRATDMPPVVDLEPDVATKNGPDRWRGHAPSAILAETKAFLTAVEDATGRRPLLYTNREWWRSQINASGDLGPLSDYPVWLANYSKTSRASETPPPVGSSPYALWQFTQSATLDLGFNGGFDASIFKGSREAFYARFGVMPFA